MSSNIELEIEERQGVGRRGHPVTVGVPFPPGQLFSAENLRLLDSGGKELPLQAQPQKGRRWEDGSLRWVLLDFQVDMAPQEKKSLYLQLKAPSEPQPPIPRPLQVSENEKEIAVDTGPLKFVVSKKKFDLFQQVWFRGEEMLSEEEKGIFVKDGEGNLYASCLDKDVTVEIEERGALRTVIKASGFHTSLNSSQNFLTFVVRIYAYANQPFLKVYYSFYHIPTDPERSEVKEVLSGPWFGIQSVYYCKVGEIAIKTPLRLSTEASTLLGGYYLHTHEVEGSASLYQREATSSRHGGEHVLQYKTGSRVRRHGPHYAVSINRPEVVRDLPAGIREEVRRGGVEGWIDCCDSHHGLTISLQNFWQNFPKKVAAENGCIELSILPEEAGKLELTEGAGRTHEIFYYFHDAENRREQVERACEIFREPLIAVVSPEWQQKSGAWGNIYPYVPRKNPNFEMRARVKYKGSWDEAGDPPWNWLPGMMNYPDSGGEQHGIASFGNNNYDQAHGLFLQHIRTGKRDFFLDGEAQIHHTMDVDHIRFSREELHFEGLHIHCVDHTTAPTRPSHQWLEGFFDYYHLTGYREAYEVGRAVGRNCIRQLSAEEIVLENEREAGWNLIALVAAYDNTGEECYLQAATELVKKVRQWQDKETGVWQHMQPMRGTRYVKGAYLEFPTALLLIGLYKYWKAGGQEEVKETFRRGVSALADAIQCALSFGHSLFINLETFAYAYEMLGTSEYLEAGMKRWEERTLLGEGIYSFETEGMAGAYRSIFPVMHVAEKLGLLPEAWK